MKKEEIEKVCDSLESQLRSLEICFEKILPSDLFHIQQMWRENFSRNIKKQTGNWIYNDYDWHTFSYNFYPHNSGIKAIKEYDSLIAKKIIIIFSSQATSEKDTFGYILESPKKPSYAFLREFLREWPRLADIYIIHENFSWTFVLTHEDDENKSLLGPYFSRK